jgi:hypothetical protein
MPKKGPGKVGLLAVADLVPVLVVVVMVSGVDDENVAALNLRLVLLLPPLEVLRAVDIVVPHAELREIDDARGPEEILER